jgi:hypothetical protein
MIIKTKKYQLESKTFIAKAFKNIMIEFWWAWLVPVFIMLIPIFVSGAFWWCFSIALVLIILYLLFWLVQFAGVTQLEQNKILFEKLAYEIDSRQILIKLNPKQGMPITWDKVVKVIANKDEFLVFLSKVQFIHLPHKIFRTENDLKFMESILKRKNFIK